MVQFPFTSKLLLSVISIYISMWENCGAAPMPPRHRQTPVSTVVDDAAERALIWGVMKAIFYINVVALIVLILGVCIGVTLKLCAVDTFERIRQRISPRPAVRRVSTPPVERNRDRVPVLENVQDTERINTENSTSPVIAPAPEVEVNRPRPPRVVKSSIRTARPYRAALPVYRRRAPRVVRTSNRPRPPLVTRHVFGHGPFRTVVRVNHPPRPVAGPVNRRRR